jgi:asparaginyl-tRNA synthetase
MWNDGPTIANISEAAGQDIELRGWIYNKRSSGKLQFLQVRDGTGVMQCVVFKGNVTPEIFEAAAGLRQEASIVVRGQIRAEERSPIGYEMDVADLVVLQNPDEEDEYPISPKEHGTAFLMENRHLWIRSSRQQAILRVRAALVKQVRDYFDSNGFMLFDAPIFTPSACEGTSTLFETPYFEDETAYLTQSGQLYEEAGAMAFGRVYSFGPTFRAEKSKTRRHLTEFWMVEPEVAHLDLDGDMDLAEDFVATIVQGVLTTCRPYLDILERDVSKLEAIQKPFPRITYDEAVKMLHDAGKDFEWGDDFGAEEETIVSESFDRPVMIHRYPSEIKAFYMKHDPAKPKVALCVDMIAPEGVGEIIGGGQREDDIALLRERIAAHELNEEDFSWYLDLRRYGSVPHAGFGLGIERTLGWICGLPHVRESIPFPRLMQRVRP